MAPGPGSLRVFPVLTSPRQCGQVRTGRVTCPQVSCTKITSGPAAPGSQVSPHCLSATITGNRARPLSVGRYSYLSAELARLRQTALLRLAELHQQLDPFRFLVYAELAGIEIGPVR